MIKFLKRLLRWFLPECSRCGGGIKGFTSPEVMGYNFCPYCGAEIEVGK